METVEVARHGHVTIPKGVRDKYGIQDGQRYGIRVLDGGIVVLIPQPGKAAEALAELRESLVAKGATREALQAGLRRMREEAGN